MASERTLTFRIVDLDALYEIVTRLQEFARAQLSAESDYSAADALIIAVAYADLCETHTPHDSSPVISPPLERILRSVSPTPWCSGQPLGQRSVTIRLDGARTALLRRLASASRQTPQTTMLRALRLLSMTLHDRIQGNNSVLTRRPPDNAVTVISAIPISFQMQTPYPKNVALANVN